MTIVTWQAGPSLTPDDQAPYSDGAVETDLMLRLAYQLPLHQTEGAMRSIVKLPDIPVVLLEDATFSRRATTLSFVSPDRLPEDSLYLLAVSTDLKIYEADV